MFKVKLGGNARSGLGVGAMKLAALPLTIMLSVVLARNLGPEMFGLYAFGISLATILSLPGGASINQLLLRETARALSEDNHALLRGARRRAYQWFFCWACLIWAGGAVYYALMRSQMTGPEVDTLLFVMLLFPLVSLLAIHAGALLGLGQPTYAQIGPIFLRPSLSLGFVLLALFSYDAFGLHLATFSQFMGCLIAVFVSYWAMRRRYPRALTNADPAYLDAQWRKAVPSFALIAIAVNINIEIGILLLGVLGSQSDVGALRVAQSGAQLLSFPLFIMNMILAPNAASLFKTQQIDTLKALTKRAQRAAFALSVLGAIPLIFFPEPILAFVFTEAYAQVASLPLRLLAIGHVINVSFGAMGILLSMAGFERSTLWGQISGLIASIFVCAVLIPSFGPTGAALGICSGILVRGGFLLVECRRNLGFHPLTL